MRGCGSPVRALRTPVGGAHASTVKTAEIRTESGEVVCSRCELAESPFRRMRGLLGRDGLEPGEGMLISPCPSVTTFFMRFAIDVVFLDRDRQIVKVIDSLRPWRNAGARRAHAALELPAGAARSLGLEPGVKLVLDDRSTA
jgi:uncharacterized membrane protein (UPF0127 family)